MRRAAIWTLSAVVAAPLTIVLHELGHFAAASLLRHPNVVLHYASISSDAKKLGYPAHELAIVAAAGPVVTCIIAALCCVAARIRPRPFIVAAGLFAPMKFSVGAVFLYFWLRGVRNSSPNFDEYNLARLLGISPVVPVSIALLVAVGTWIFLVRCIQPGERVLAVICSAAGAGLGLLLYAAVLGPRLLP